MLAQIDPKLLTETKIEEIAAFIHRHGHIPNIGHVRDGVRRATMLFAKFEACIMIGVAAAKRPRDDYRCKSFKGAGSLLDPSLFADELGYIAVRGDRQGKGIGPTLAYAALEVIGKRPVFATTRADNKNMRHILEKPEFGFRREGKDYPSDDSNLLTLFVRRNA